MTRSETALASEHEGQVLVLVAVASLVLVAFAAMAIDVGLFLSERRGAQNAADAAALAVARAMLDEETNQALLEETANRYATENGYPEMDIELTFDWEAEEVVVEVKHDVERIFLGAFYDGEWSVTAEAAAALQTIPYDYGLIALDESGSPIEASGNTHVRVNEGGVMSNGDIDCRGSSTITADTVVHSAGTQRATGVCVIEGDEGTSEGRAPIDDPLEGTPQPPAPSVPSGLSQGECEYEDQPWNSAAVCSPGRYTSWNWGNGYGLKLEPGTYVFDTNVSVNPYGTREIEMVSGSAYTFYVRNSTIDIGSGIDFWDMGSNDVDMYFENSTFKFSGGTDLVTLGSGLYYFDNSDFEVAAGASVHGNDVSFFFTNGGRFRTRGSTADMRLSGPSNPLYPGMPPNMLIHAPPSNSSFEVDLGASTNGTLLDGVFYMPTGEFTLSGNTSGTWARGQMIVGSYSMVGSSNGSIDYEQYVELGKPGVWLVR